MDIVFIMLVQLGGGGGGGGGVWATTHFSWPVALMWPLYFGKYLTLACCSIIPLKKAFKKKEEKKALQQCSTAAAMLMNSKLNSLLKSRVTQPTYSKEMIQIWHTFSEEVSFSTKSNNGATKCPWPPSKEVGIPSDSHIFLPRCVCVCVCVCVSSHK